MTSQNYRGMNLDQLIDAFKKVAVQDVPGEGQEAAVDVINEVMRAIAEQPGHIERYRDLLHDPEPAVRYSAALSVKDVDPAAAVPIFRELRDGHYGLGALAWIELRELRLRGFL